MPKTLAEKAFLILLAAVLCLGLCRVALLPPFEGLDETGHYSRILASAFPPAQPDGRAFLDQGVRDYPRTGPMARGWIENFTMHQDGEEKSYRDYSAFFSDPKARGAYDADAPAPREFRPSNRRNWQMQHPPSYYVLMGHVARLLPEGATLKARLFTLRGASFLIAFLAFGAALEATRRHLAPVLGREGAARLAAAAAFMPLAMPAFFTDLARLGNNSLALAGFCVAWIFLLRHRANPRDPGEWLGLGLGWGLALLAKPTIVPVAAGMGLLLCVLGLRREGVKGLVPALAAGGLALVLAGPWYIPWLADYAFSSKSTGVSIFACHPGETPGLPMGAGDIAFFLGMTAAGAVHYFSDWTFFGFPLPFFTMLMLPAATFLGFAAAKGRDPFSVQAQMLWTTGPLLAAIALHSVCTGFVMGAEFAPTPAYYIHITAPALALALGGGLSALLASRARDIALILGFTALLQAGYLFMKQAQMYAGCWIPKAEGPVSLPCATDAAELYGRLSLLSYPGLAGGALMLGLGLGALGFGFLFRTGKSAHSGP